MVRPEVAIIMIMMMMIMLLAGPAPVLVMGSRLAWPCCYYCA